METEIQFLIKLLLESDISESVRKQMIERIGIVEASGRPQPKVWAPALINGTPQAASTIAAIERHQQEPITVVSSPVAAQAVMQRQALIDEALSGSQKGRSAKKTHSAS